MRSAHPSRSGPGPLPVRTLGEHAELDGTCMPSLGQERSPRVLTGPLPILQMAPSEGTVTQIGLLSQDIHRLTVGPCPSPQDRCWEAP